MYQTQFTPSTGEAYIAVKKNRVKSYPTNLAGVHNSIYLSDKQEFEIELYNPSTSTKLAKISINGKPISLSGVVLKPGQRSYIERYIDTPRKFKFETYVVDNNPSALAAIQKNGLIEISFYDEHVPSQYNTIPTVYYDSLLRSSNIGAGGQNVTGGNINWLNQQQQNSLRDFGSMSCSKGDITANFCSSTGSINSFSTQESLKETGKVEQGSQSNQKFTNYTGSFNSWTTNTVTIKLLPYSEKPLEISEIAQYCTQCGTKNKGGNFKFCPTCGTKF